MKNIKKLILVTIGFIIVVPYKKTYAMPRSRTTPAEYNYNDLSSGHYREPAKNHLLNNRAIILFGSHNQRITVGNEKVAKRYTSRGIGSARLQLHHIFFKGIRTSFPAIPYLCMQTPRDHHDRYHHDRDETDVNFSTFTNMRDYLYNLRSSIVAISRRRNDIYSNICIAAANITTDCQLHWIGQRYSWLHSVDNGKYLMLAQRLIAKNCFPNQILANKVICESQHNYISNQLALSNFVLEKIPVGEPGGHLTDLLQARIYSLCTYVTNFNPLTRSQALNMANNLYSDSEKFHNPISHQQDLAGEFDGESSAASSLADE